jgi:hypothetical protein
VYVLACFCVFIFVGGRAGGRRVRIEGGGGRGGVCWLSFVLRLGGPVLEVGQLPVQATERSEGARTTSVSEASGIY